MDSIEFAGLAVNFPAGDEFGGVIRKIFASLGTFPKHLRLYGNNKFRVVSERDT
jgi:hypothetical protein